MSNAPHHVIPPYGVAIQSAISEGKLPQMKALLAKRDNNQAEPAELRAAYEQLAKEVARLERH
ncbi:DUF1843 domain-containing protein [Pseudomonas sp. MSSRFD41]|uniref:DUF1843 domain-containing protein n=1 Tax=unclassified Pseudomonas TaxID=196821 RepID=UPI00163AC9BF|nr:DUF1843 domain-containing protein [Pseudomonas sp. MSSRFD41]MBC2659565.1 DUF1843 domain-containing protein [Pseudomonas sp. MSSRFD41]